MVTFVFSSVRLYIYSPVVAVYTTHCSCGIIEAVGDLSYTRIDSFIYIYIDTLYTGIIVDNAQ